MKKIFVCEKCGKSHASFFTPKWCDTPGCDSREFAETAAAAKTVVVVVEPVTSTGSYSAHDTLRYEFGVDAAGTKVERSWTPGLSEGYEAGTHDGLRDGASRSHLTKDLMPGPWKVRVVD